MASKPQQGQVIRATNQRMLKRGKPIPAGREFRPKTAPERVDRLQVKLRSKPGVTDPKHLRVPFWFQVAPLEEFSWEGSHSHQEYETLRSGQFSRKGGVQLRSVSFETMFVDYDAPWVSWNGATQADAQSWAEPYWLAEELNGLMRTGTPFWLLVGMYQQRGHWDLQILVTLRSLRVSERAGEPDTKYISASFTEWRELAATERRRRRRPGPRNSERQIVIHNRPRPLAEAGAAAVGLQTLAQVAKRYYGKPSLWPLIAAASGLEGIAGNETIYAYLNRRHIRRVTLRIPPRPGDHDRTP